MPRSSASLRLLGSTRRAFEFTVWPGLPWPRSRMAVAAANPGVRRGVLVEHDFAQGFQAFRRVLLGDLLKGALELHRQSRA